MLRNEAIRLVLRQEQSDDRDHENHQPIVNVQRSTIAVQKPMKTGMWKKWDII